MITLSYNPIIINNNAPNQGVGSCKSKSLSGQLKTPAHVYFIPLSQMNLPLLLFLIMLQNHATLSDIRKYLQKELAMIYSEGEVRAMVNIIMEHLGHPSPQAFLNPQHQPGVASVAQINEIVSDIHTKRPIQYILGKTSFLDLSIRINEDALIPRSETEELVHRIINGTKKPPERILDLCTGSGCIALALKNAFPEAHVTGLDNSIKALKLARSNGEKNQLEVEWVHGDLLSTDSLPIAGKFDLVVSNPPYVRMSEKALMEENVLDFEPHSALFVADEDPLVFYKAIARLTPEILPAGSTVWLEINEIFGAEVADLFENSGFKQTLIYKDIHEKERFIQARK